MKEKKMKGETLGKETCSFENQCLKDKMMILIQNIRTILFKRIMYLQQQNNEIFLCARHSSRGLTLFSHLIFTATYEVDYYI